MTKAKKKWSLISEAQSERKETLHTDSHQSTDSDLYQQNDHDSGELYWQDRIPNTSEVSTFRFVSQELTRRRPNHVKEPNSKFYARDIGANVIDQLSIRMLDLCSTGQVDSSCGVCQA